MRSLLLVAALLFAFAPRPVRACSCAVPGPDVIAPADGATDVPQDAMLWIGQGGYAGMETSWWQVVDAATGAPRGGAFRVITDEIVQGLAFAFDPPLVEGERVQLRRGDGTIVSTFTVGAKATSAAPGPAFVIPAGYRSFWSEPGSSCGDVLRLARVAVGPGGVLAVIDTSGLATAGDGPVAAGVRMIGLPQGVELGAGECAYGWPAAAPGAELSVRGGSFALNGRFSGWSEPVTLVFPVDPPIGPERRPGGGSGETEEGGCSAAGGRRAGGWWVIGVIGVWIALRGGGRGRGRGSSAELRGRSSSR